MTFPSVCKAVFLFEPTRSILAKRNGAASSAAQFTKPGAKFVRVCELRRVCLKMQISLDETCPDLDYQKGWSQDLLVTKMQLMGIYITRDILANIETLAAME